MVAGPLGPPLLKLPFGRCWSTICVPVMGIGVRSGASLNEGCTPAVWANAEAEPSASTAATARMERFMVLFLSDGFSMKLLAPVWRRRVAHPFRQLAPALHTQRNP